ncbi:WYL domain-containing protein [bacterium]|nr:WYL domain-containing protein [bacterium]
MNVTERINRILFILSYVSKNQGVTIEKLAEQVGMRPKQLMKELDFMLLIGKPPFRPDDYVDIYVEDEQVYVEFDQMLNRPLRLTRPEAMALLMSLKLLDPEVDPKTVRSLTDTIEKAISNSIDPEARPEDRIVLEQPSRPVSRYFNLLRQGIDQNRKAEIDYYSLTRNTTSHRVIHPYFLTKNLGYWYLTGFCELREGLRTFKFERILSVELYREKFSPPEEVENNKYKHNFLKSMGPRRIEIYFDSKVAPWIKERWGSSVTKAENGGVVLNLASETLEYPSRLVLSFAPYAKPLNPPELIEKVKQDSQEIAEWYKTKVMT